MKHRIGAYLSKRTAGRLTAAAKRRGTTKSALVEAALNSFLDSDDVENADAVARGLAELSDQVAQLDRDLGIVSEIVALHARFHLAVTPEVPAASQQAACRRGSARFDEFAAQVERRMQLGTPLLQETMDRLDTTRPRISAGEVGDGDLPRAASIAHAPNLAASTRADEVSETTAAVREDGSTENFRELRRTPIH